MLSYKSIPEDEFFHISCQEKSANEEVEKTVNKRLVDQVVLTATFRNVPVEAKEWRGFTGRVLPFDIEADEGIDDTGLMVVYRRTYKPDKTVINEMLQYKRTLKPVFAELKKLNEFVENGLPEHIVEELFPNLDRNKTLTPAQRKQLDEVDDLYDVDETIQGWDINPRGYGRRRAEREHSADV